MDEVIALLRLKAIEKEKRGLLAEANALRYSAALLENEKSEVSNG